MAKKPARKPAKAPPAPKDPEAEAAEVERRLRDARAVIEMINREKDPPPPEPEIIKDAPRRPHRFRKKDPQPGNGGSPPDNGGKKQRSYTSPKGLSNDLLWIYKKMGGRSELLQQIKNDRDLKKLFLREMISMERRRTESVSKAVEAAGKGRPGSTRSIFTIKGLFKEMSMNVNEKKPDEPETAEQPGMSMSNVPPELQSVVKDEDDWDDWGDQGEQDGEARGSDAAQQTG
jgi:hypothetical protein